MSKKSLPQRRPGAKEADKTGKDLIESALLPFAIVATTAGSVIGVIAKGTELVALYYENPVLYGLLLAAAAALCSHAGIKYYAGVIGLRWVRRARAMTLSAILLFYVASLSYSSWCASMYLCSPATWRPVFNELLFFRQASAQPIAPRDLIVEGVTVDRSRSSFLYRKDDLSIHAEREKVDRLVVEFDRRLIGVFQNASCRGLDGEKPIEDALPIWRYLLQQRSQSVIAARLGDYNGYRALIKTGGDTIFKALPNASELGQLKKDKPADFQILMGWLSNCVGLADPVLIWTLRNSSDRELLLTSVDYEVIDVGQVKGGGPTPVEPIDVATHDLIHEVGIQNQNLEPRISMPPKSIASVRIRYRLQADQPGYTWLLRAIFNASDGTKGVSDEIKLFSAKNPYLPK